MTDIGATAGPIDEDRVFAVLVDVVGVITEMEPAELGRDRRISELPIDSLYAAEILAQTERRLEADIDFGDGADDWSGLTLGGLASKIVASATPVGS